jgi:hypothetical protein
MPYDKRPRYKTVGEAEYQAFLASLPKERIRHAVFAIGEPPMIYHWDEAARLADSPNAVPMDYIVAKYFDGEPERSIWAEETSPQQFFAERKFTPPKRAEGLSQKFEAGERVKVTGGHIPDGTIATVLGSYADLYGGSNTRSYSLQVNGGAYSWFEEAWLSPAQGEE